jgi:hypothetical protein
MIEGRIFPGGGRMACPTVCAESAAMVIVFGVASEAAGRCAFEDVILVALGAVHIDMGTGKLESCKVMVKLGGFPGSGGMANPAICAETAVMMIIFRMACETIGGRTFKVGVLVTLGAIHREMSAGQLEWC